MRNIAILRDGYSDYLVLKKLVSILLEKHRGEILNEGNFIDLEPLNITNSLQRYLDKATKTSNYSFHTPDAISLIKNLISIYYGCYSKLSIELNEINNKSIIIINTDAERLLVQRQNYFNEWAYNLKGLLYYSIEQFYELMVSQGHDYERLPYYIPLVPFPSSEIIIAACMYNITTENIRSLKPTPALKQKVYNCDSIAKAIENGAIYDTLDGYMIDENIKEIYKELPEVRMLIHSLTN